MIKAEFWEVLCASQGGGEKGKGTELPWSNFFLPCLGKPEEFAKRQSSRRTNSLALLPHALPFLLFIVQLLLSGAYSCELFPWMRLNNSTKLYHSLHSLLWVLKLRIHTGIKWDKFVSFSSVLGPVVWVGFLLFTSYIEQTPRQGVGWLQAAPTGQVYADVHSAWMMGGRRRIHALALHPHTLPFLLLIVQSVAFWCLQLWVISCSLKGSSAQDKAKEMCCWWA